MARIDKLQSQYWFANQINQFSLVGLPNTGGVPDGIKDIVHPSFAYIPGGFGGHNFWMAASPYPQSLQGGGEPYENPCIFYADVVDGVFPVSGFTAIPNNPIDPTPSGGYNSDPELAYFNGYLYCFWRTRASSQTGFRTAIYVSKSSDGLNWSQKQMIYGSDDTGNDLCPMYIYTNNKHRIYLVEAGGYNETFNLKIIESNTIDGEYTEVGHASVEGLANIWHGGVFEYNGDMYLIAGGTSNGINKPLELFLAKKDPDAENFVFYEYPLASASYRPFAKVFDGKLVIYNSCKGTTGYSGLVHVESYYPAGNFVCLFVADMEDIIKLMDDISIVSE